MKAAIALIFLITLLIKISAFAQEFQPQIQVPPQENTIIGELSALTETIDLYYEEMIRLKTKLALNDLKITSSKLSTEDSENLRFLQETRENILSGLKIYKTQIEELSNNPEALEISENSKLLYNIALVKAFLPRYDSAKVSFLTRLVASLKPQYVEEILSRDEALKLFFTQFESNEPSKNALNLKYRFNEVIKTHNTIATKVNQEKEANIYQVYPTNLKLSTGIQEAALYQSIIKGAEYAVPTESSPLLVTSKVGPDHFALSLSCAGLFGI